MIAFIQGAVLVSSENSCVVQTQGGVGYELFLPSPLLSRLPEKGAEVSFFISTIVREDALDLYGFSSWDERQVFNVLLTISKLGPKTSLALLSIFSPDELRKVVANEDPAVLTRVPGIGKKTAQHIFLELKYKLKLDVSPAALDLGEKGANTFRDAMAGLTNLGYVDEEAREVLEQVFKDETDLDVALALRLALKLLAKKR